MQQQHSSAAITRHGLADGVIVRCSHVEFIVVVVIVGEAATADDDGDYDINRANVSLPVIQKSVAFLGQGKRKEGLASIMRASPREQ